MINRTQTFEKAVQWCEWRKDVKRTFSQKFLWFQEGDRVRFQDGRIGVVESYNYFPQSDMYSIHVTFGSKLECFTDPYLMEKVHAE